ncbi:unnamed protein product [Musa textilis]
MMDLRESIGRQTAFALRLAKQVGTEAARDVNLAFSPLSVHLVLSLLAAGSKGRTLDQILSFLGLGDSGGVTDLNALSSQVVAVVLADGSARGGPRVSSANGVFFDSSLLLKPSFKEIVTQIFRADTKIVDFQTKAVEVTNEVNSWVENITAGLIKELLPSGSVDNNTRLVLGNALYFKGSWNEKFDSSQTNDSEFHLLNGTSVQVPFMSSKKHQYLCSYDGFKVLRLPYKQGEDARLFSMYIFLPDARDGLWSLQEKLKSKSEFLTHRLPMTKVAVGKFKLPKFKISFGFEASAVLKSSGLALPFSADADLSEVADSSVGRSLYVSSVFHKSFIEVNEEGTEAAAAAAAVVALRSLPIGPLDFEADSPFIFIIREDMTGVVLFAGHVLNPSLDG